MRAPFVRHKEASLIRTNNERTQTGFKVISETRAIYQTNRSLLLRHLPFRALRPKYGPEFIIFVSFRERVKTRRELLFFNPPRYARSSSRAKRKTPARARARATAQVLRDMASLITLY